MINDTKFSDYNVLSCIGSGEFGTCYKVQKKSTNELFVWKAIDYGNMMERDKERIVSEVNLLSELNHPNIVRYYGRIIDKKSTTLYIIMECCEGGDLKTRIKKCKKRGLLFDERYIWHVLYQTARAVQACHSLLSNKTVLHRDIKPANVFLDKEGNVKLGDFGLARLLDGDGGLADTCVGTPYYMSPEILRGEKYSRKSDVWSLGCVVYELCALSPPFKGCNLPELANNIQNETVSRIPSIYSQDLQHVISKMLTVAHDARPAIETILHHPTVVSQIVNDTFDSLSRESEKMKRNSIQETCVQSKENHDLQDLMRHRLEGLKIRESMIREKELAIADRERALEKREKQVMLLDRMTKEKMLRADVYLNRCRDSRSTSSISKSTARRCNVPEPSATNVDTSFSADPGDTSILPTSSKIIPSLVAKPQLFLPKAERHVHFDKLPHLENKSQVHQQPDTHLPPSDGRTVKNRKPFKIIQGADNGHAGKPDKAVEDNFRNGVLAMFNADKQVEDPALYAVERCTWLENKRVAYKTVAQQPALNKENTVAPTGGRKCSTKNHLKPGALPMPAAYTKTGSLGHYR